MENNLTVELEQDVVEMISDYKKRNKVSLDFLPFTTYDMVQCGYPRVDHGEMVARAYSGSDSEGKLLPSNGKWCKVEEVIELIKSYNGK